MELLCQRHVEKTNNVFKGFCQIAFQETYSTSTTWKVSIPQSFDIARYEFFSVLMSLNIWKKNDSISLLILYLVFFDYLRG